MDRGREPRQPDLSCSRCHRGLGGMHPRRRNRHLANHQLVLWWACGECTFQTPRWRDVRRHSWCHRRVTEFRPVFEPAPPQHDPRDDRAATTRRGPESRSPSPAIRRPAVEEPATAETTPVGSPPASPLFETDLPWSDLERFLYEPTPADLLEKLLALPLEARREVAQAALASLGRAEASTQTSGSSSSQDSTPSTGCRSPRPSRASCTQTDGHVLVVSHNQAVHINLGMATGGSVIGPR